MELVVVIGPILRKGIDTRGALVIESGVEFRRLGVVRASKSVLGMRTPRLIWRKENSVIDREIVEINEIAHVVGNGR